MRTIVLTLALFSGIMSVAQTKTAPYFQNFDSNFNPGSGVNNLGSTIDTSWFRDNYPWSSASEYAWGGGTGATSSNNTGPSSDHTSGSGNYVYAEASAFDEDRAKLVTPEIDLDTLSNPQLTFWKHQFGSDIFNFSVQIVVNGSFFGTIYTSAGNQGNQWDKVTVPLNSYIGQTVTFIFVAWRNTSSPGNGLADIAIDDFAVDNAPICAAPSAVFADSTSVFDLHYSAANSTGRVLSYQWAFGDGTTATGIDGLHQYSSAGIYNVTLTVTDTCGQQDQFSKVVTICDTTISAFTYVQNGLVATFDASNSVVNGALLYSWDFGDGTTTTGTVVSHTYAVTGTYNVVLTVTNLCGFTYSVSQLLEPCTSLSAWWTANIISSSSAGMTVQFSSSSSVGATKYVWDFGDGSSLDTNANPIHTYAVPSLFYNVTLTVFNDCNQTNTFKSSLTSIGTEELDLASFNVYPNPTNGLVFVDLGTIQSTDLYFLITDANGNKLISDSVRLNQSVFTIDLSALAAGLYFLRVYNAEMSLQQKMVVFD